MIQLYVFRKSHKCHYSSFIVIVSYPSVHSVASFPGLSLFSAHNETMHTVSRFFPTLPLLFLSLPLSPSLPPFPSYSLPLLSYFPPPPPPFPSLPLHPSFPPSSLRPIYTILDTLLGGSLFYLEKEVLLVHKTCPALCLLCLEIL